MKTVLAAFLILSATAAHANNKIVCVGRAQNSFIGGLEIQQNPQTGNFSGGVSDNHMSGTVDCQLGEGGVYCSGFWTKLSNGLGEPVDARVFVDNTGRMGLRLKRPKPYGGAYVFVACKAGRN